VKREPRLAWISYWTRWALNYTQDLHDNVVRVENQLVTEGYDLLVLENGKECINQRWIYALQEILEWSLDE